MRLIDAPEITLSAPVNLRDLGGLRVTGGVIRPGFAIRADDLATVTADTADRLVEEGLSAVIDLRSPEEVALTGRGPFSALGSVGYHHIPFLTTIAEAVDAPHGQDRSGAAGSGGDTEAAPAGGSGSTGEPFDQSGFGRMYRRMYSDATSQIVTALAIIAHSRGAVAFHCAAGQDRTGVLAASLLLALGAEPEVILADYVRTGENTAAIHRRILPVIGPLMRSRGLDLDAGARVAVRSQFSPAPMLELLASLSEAGADPLAELRAAGLTDGLVARLRERALNG